MLVRRFRTCSKVRRPHFGNVQVPAEHAGCRAFDLSANWALSELATMIRMHVYSGANAALLSPSEGGFPRDTRRKPMLNLLN